VICGFLVTTETRVIFIAAFEFDGDYIQLRMPVDTSGLLVHRLSKYVDSIDSGRNDWKHDRILLS
jgi:hypothetical protein